LTPAAAVRLARRHDTPGQSTPQVMTNQLYLHYITMTRLITTATRTGTQIWGLIIGEKGQVCACVKLSPSGVYFFYFLTEVAIDSQEAKL